MTFREYLKVSTALFAALTFGGLALLSIVAVVQWNVFAGIVYGLFVISFGITGVVFFADRGL